MQELLGSLRDQERVDAILEPVGPRLAAAKLDPWAWEPASKLWDDEHYAEAVKAAASPFDDELPRKLGLPRGGAGPSEAFSEQPATTDMRRLRFRQYPEGSDDWKNAHNGAKFLGMGLVAGVRNLVTHGGRRPDEREALEMLAGLSLFARWVRQAEVETHA